MIRTTLIAAAFVLGTASIVAHASEYWREIRFSKDFALDYSSARAYLDGRDPYAKIRMLVEDYLHPPADVLENNILPGGNWHPPIKVLITVPFAALPYRAAGVAWLLLSALCFVAAGRLLARELGWGSLTSVALGFAFLAVPVVQLDLSAGQLNGPMLLIMVLAWRALRRGADRFGGAALGAVASLKPFPALLVAPLLGARRYRAVAFAAAAAIGISLLGALVLGPSNLESFIKEGGGEEGLGYWDSSPANVSWWGVVTRWLTRNGWVRHGFDLGGVGIAIAAVFAIAFVLLALKPPSRLTADAFWASVPLMLLAWPIVWIHYLALALPWVVLALREAGRRSSPALIAGVAVTSAVLLMGFLPGTPSLGAAGTFDVAVPYQLPTAALVAAVLLEAAVSRRGRGQGAVPTRGL